MEHGHLGFLRETVIELIKECEDADLLDLLCKLLADSGVEAATPLHTQADHPADI